MKIFRVFVGFLHVDRVTLLSRYMSAKWSGEIHHNYNTNKHCIAMSLSSTLKKKKKPGLVVLPCQGSQQKWYSSRCINKNFHSSTLCVINFHSRQMFWKLFRLDCINGRIVRNGFINRAQINLTPWKIVKSVTKCQDALFSSNF